MRGICMFVYTYILEIKCCAFLKKKKGLVMHSWLPKKNEEFYAAFNKKNW